jgi:hypothetical protein
VTGSPRRAALVAGPALFLVYLATLAPGLTLWDAGEFASAVESLGIPHPPGTPLYVLVARAWRLVFPFLETATATNLLAAASTAAAGAIAAALMSRWMRDTAAGVGAGLLFGAVSTVWLSATETEVYSASLLLSMLMVAVADRTGRNSREPGAGRGAMRILAYLFALAPPLHLSAMVAAPGAIALASMDDRLPLDNRFAFDRERTTLLVGAALLAVGVGTGSFPAGIAGGVVLVAGALWFRNTARGAMREALIIVALVALAASVFLFLLLRARLDPALNQGNPSTLGGVVDVIARRQYDVPGLWPRRAPVWLQVGNLFQYADWQFALGLDRAVGASWLRTPFTPLYFALGIVGSLAHRRRDRRSWAGMLILLTAATLGVVAYLNLRAGPSYGYGVLPADADREARERDYFFALGFAVFGMWAGQGAVTLGRAIAARFGVPAFTWAGLALAALPLALNWRAVDRRREPGASLPLVFARATLESLPARSVLFVAGDNDTYPLWYAQTARGVRPDVTIVTVPLLGAVWYRAELARRHGLYAPPDTAGWRGPAVELGSIATLARRKRRPIAAGVALDPDGRAALGERWELRGLAYLSRPDEAAAPATSIDAHAVDSTAAGVARLFPGVVDPARFDDPAARYLASLLACPALARDAARGTAADSARLLASRCNFR